MIVLTDDCACAIERVQDCSNVYMRPYATACHADIMVIELRSNSVELGIGDHAVLANHVASRHRQRYARINFRK